MKEKARSVFKTEKKRNLIIPIISAAVLLILFLILHFTYGRKLLEIVSDYNTFKSWLSAFAVPPNLAFVAVRAFQTVIKIIPAEPLEIASGYIWGVFGGFFYCLLGTEIGSLVILVITRKFGVKFISCFIDTSKIDEWSFIKNSKRKYFLLFVIYLIPGTPKDLITYFIGITDTKTAPFLFITGVARIPAIISSTWCGSTLIDKNYIAFMAIFAGITVFSLAGTAVGTKYFNKKRGAENNYE